MVFFSLCEKIKEIQSINKDQRSGGGLCTHMEPPSSQSERAIVDQVHHTHLVLDFDFDRPSAKVSSPILFFFLLIDLNFKSFAIPPHNLLLLRAWPHPGAL
jgi:hypothetical protein